MFSQKHGIALAVSGNFNKISSMVISLTKNPEFSASKNFTHFLKVCFKVVAVANS